MKLVIRAGTLVTLMFLGATAMAQESNQTVQTVVFGIHRLDSFSLKSQSDQDKPLNELPPIKVTVRVDQNLDESPKSVSLLRESHIDLAAAGSDKMEKTLQGKSLLFTITD